MDVMALVLGEARAVWVQLREARARMEAALVRPAEGWVLLEVAKMAEALPVGVGGCGSGVAKHGLQCWHCCPLHELVRILDVA